MVMVITPLPLLKKKAGQVELLGQIWMGDIAEGGYPYLRVFSPGGVLMPGHGIARTLSFKRLSNAAPTHPLVSLNALSGLQEDRAPVARGRIHTRAFGTATLSA